MKRFRLGYAAVELVRGDIVAQNVDVVVNAANESLTADGAVCEAIFRAAGQEKLAAACARLAPCATGDARITPGFRLKARHIIHAVGPVYNSHEPERSNHLLASAYCRSLDLARQHRLPSIAFPCISTGSGEFPLRTAAEVVLVTFQEELERPHKVKLVRLVLWNEASEAAYHEAANDLALL